MGCSRADLARGFACRCPGLIPRATLGLPTFQLHSTAPCGGMANEPAVGSPQMPRSANDLALSSVRHPDPSALPVLLQIC